MTEPKPTYDRVTAMTEAKMQAILMGWIMRTKNHAAAVTNSTVLLPWEADVCSLTKSMYIHEYEIKISLADYKRDAKDKPWKFLNISKPIYSENWMPANYFWYVTCEGFEITPPDYAGWLVVSYNDRRKWWDVTVKKEAPRLHKNKVEPDKKIATIARLLSFRLMNELERSLQNGK